MWNRAIYDSLTAIYAVSLLFYFWDAVQPTRRVNRTALVLLFLVFLGETAELMLRLRSDGYMPVYSRFDALLLVSWLLLLVALVVDAFYRVDLLVFFANVLGFSFVLFNSFSPNSSIAHVVHDRDLLILHIISAILSYVALSLSFVFSAMYLLQEKLLREKRFNRWFLHLPGLETLDSYAYRSVLIGFPLLLIAMVFGTVWGEVVLHRWILLDPKPIATVAVWLMYAVYLVLRIQSGWAGKNLVWYNCLCFIAVLLNFAFIGNFSSFHQSI